VSSVDDVEKSSDDHRSARVITKLEIDQAYSDLHESCGGVKNDYFGVVYLQKAYRLPIEDVRNQVAFGGNDYGIDGFHFDLERRNLYLFQFKNSESAILFAESYKRLIEKGLEQVFSTPNQDDTKNQLLLHLRSCILENRSVINQVIFHFVFAGDPEQAERSKHLENLRENLENKKYLAENFFDGRQISFLIEYRSSSGRIGRPSIMKGDSSFRIPMTDLVVVNGPQSQKMHIGFIRLTDLANIYQNSGPRFLDSNIRYGLGTGKNVNRVVVRALKSIVLDQTESPEVFAFHHNGVTMFAEIVERENDELKLTAPRLLNGAQTVTNVVKFLEDNKSNPKLKDNQERLDRIRVLCKVITEAAPDFVSKVTINNNRQTPVEAWNLHANDDIQLQLQDKFRNDVKVYYERQENAFRDLSAEHLGNSGIAEQSRPIQMLKLTQTFLLTDGHLSRVSDMRRVFEDEKLYSDTFRPSRLNADSRRVLLCYKIQFRLRKAIQLIESHSRSKYAFVNRGRNMVWALLAQGILNSKDIDSIAEEFGTSMTLPARFVDVISSLANTKVRMLLSHLSSLPEYRDQVKDENYTFLKTDLAFNKCMEEAHKRWEWTHQKLSR
jgi:hypothetical protein